MIRTNQWAAGVIRAKPLTHWRPLTRYLVSSTSAQKTILRSHFHTDFDVTLLQFNSYQQRLFSKRDCTVYLRKRVWILGKPLAEMRFCRGESGLQWVKYVILTIREWRNYFTFFPILTIACKMHCFTASSSSFINELGSSAERNTHRWRPPVVPGLKGVKRVKTIYKCAGGFRGGRRLAAWWKCSPVSAWNPPALRPLWCLSAADSTLLRFLEKKSCRVIL